MMDLFLILLIALILDWYFGEPDFLWSRISHPIVFFGKAVSLAESKLNREEDDNDQQYKKGALAITLLIAAALAVALLLSSIVSALGLAGFLLEIFVVFVLLAQKSLKDHVANVALGLRENGLEGGRGALSMIVGRDPSKLDKSGISRAAIESLAENFSDGVVAPAFWYLVFGLPGIIVYKMINTADSMIAYKSERYLWFGRVTAQIDDLANWLPARISALFIALGVATLTGFAPCRNAIMTAFRDSGLHRSPNAGWPEAAMAGGAGLALGGPRVYSEEVVEQAYLNAAGRHDLTTDDIEHTLKIFARACFCVWTTVGLLMFL